MREEILRVMDRNARISVTDLAAILDASEDEINERLAAWVHGGMDEEIDDLVGQYGFRYGED